MLGKVFVRDKKLIYLMFEQLSQIRKRKNNLMEK